MGFVHDFGMDAAGMFTNIDKIVEAFDSAREAEGIPPMFEENVEVAKKVKMKETNDEPDKNQKKGGWFQGVFGLEEDFDDEDDGDGIYVCEYCDLLGYHQKYRPEICDTCRMCETCAEYEDGDCSGCTYSVYRDGQYYRDKIPESELMTSHDIDLFQELKSSTVPCKRFERIHGLVTKQR